MESSIQPELAVYAFLPTSSLASSLGEVLQSGSYALRCFEQGSQFLEAVNQDKRDIDCLILEETPEGLALLGQLRSHSALLPAVLLRLSPRPDFPEEEADGDHTGIENYRGEEAIPTYHNAILYLEADRLRQITIYVETAIDQFLKLAVRSPSTADQTQYSVLDEAMDEETNLVLKQRRLAQKLKERLGYLGIYYKRDPRRFLRSMNADERQRLLVQLKQDYQGIILNYFLDDRNLNQKIEAYINAAFFADVPIAQIVEIHMEIMDEFSKQLKLEGRSEEILLDYRLTLIDTLANLCEMYRRSIPRNA
ncbi:MAG: circadian clock protein KaiA [Synechococcales bacterium]|nr:circadian clock protein KaiA [Synechococcales bacterium]